MNDILLRLIRFCPKNLLDQFSLLLRKQPRQLWGQGEAIIAFDATELGPEESPTSKDGWVVGIIRGFRLCGTEQAVYIARSAAPHNKDFNVRTQRARVQFLESLRIPGCVGYSRIC